jgi:hypothetical protein
MEAFSSRNRIFPKTGEEGEEDPGILGHIKRRVRLHKVQ